MNFFKKSHKWLGIFLTLFIILFSISGVILNHRELLSGANVNRNILPEEYQYNNWNNAGLKSTIKISNDSILLYGNIGIWLTNNKFDNFSDFNAGLPTGIDNKKTCKIYKSSRNQLYAGTLFGAYKYNKHAKSWEKIELPIHEKRIVDILEIKGNLHFLSRSHLIKVINESNFDVITVPKPENYDNKVGMFKTLWMIHSGEIWGIAGKVIVDIIGLIFIFLSVTGIIYFIIPMVVKRRFNKGKGILKLKKRNLTNLKLHNKIGWITILFLIITTATGMFLRPPLLIAIAESKVGKIPFTELDSPNAWFDKLRAVLYDDELERYIIATNQGVYYSDDNLQSNLKRFYPQPPLSVMGITVFKKTESNKYLIGSFEGLFEWNTKTDYIEDYIKKTEYIRPKKKSRPLGEFMVAGFTTDYNNSEIYFDYNNGAASIDKKSKFIDMNSEIQNQPISLWNVALEIHTARMYKIFFGKYYILFIPIAGFLIIFILVSGLIVWFRKYRNVDL